MTSLAIILVLDCCPKMSCWGLITGDILALVSTFVGQADLCSICGVCRNWKHAGYDRNLWRLRGLILDHDSVVAKVSSRGRKRNLVSNFVNQVVQEISMQERFSAVTKLSLAGLQLNVGASQKCPILVVLFRELTHLQHLDLSSVVTPNCSRRDFVDMLVGLAAGTDLSSLVLTCGFEGLRKILAGLQSLVICNYSGT